MSTSGAEVREEEVVTASASETQALGRRWAQGLKPGDVLLLSGGLGAGKTCLAKGLAEGLGHRGDEVASPSFTLVREHKGGRLPFYHIDLYRLGSAHEAAGLGLEELFDGDGVCAVEWPERLGPQAPAGAWRVAISTQAGDERRIVASRP